MQKISVIVPIYNRGKYIVETIKNIINQSYKNFELILIDDGSTDNTKDVIFTFINNLDDPIKKKIKYIYQPNNGAAAARNTGIKQATGDLIAFIDSDDVPTEDWLKILSNEFTNEHTGVCIGRTITLKPDTLIQEILSLKDKDEHFYYLNNKNDLKHFKTTNLMVKSNVFKQIGLFDENLQYAEDTDYSLRMKGSVYKIKYVENAIVYYRQRETLKDFKKQKFNYGTGKIQLYKKYPEYSTNLLKEILETVLRLASLCIKSIIRVFKFVLKKDFRKKIFILEHPLEIIATIYNFIGRLNYRIKLKVWF